MERLLDYFLVVGHGDKLRPLTEEEAKLVDPSGICHTAIDTANPLKMTFKAEVMDRFPLVDYHNCEFPKLLEWFCLPAGLTLSSEPGVPKVHYFIAMGGMGADVYRLYGSVFTFFEQVPVELLETLKVQLEAYEASHQSPTLPSDTPHSGESSPPSQQPLSFFPSPTPLSSSPSFRPAPPPAHLKPKIPRPPSRRNLEHNGSSPMLISSGSSKALVPPVFQMKASSSTPSLPTPLTPAPAVSQSLRRLTTEKVWSPKCLVLLSHHNFLPEFRVLLTELYRMSSKPMAFPIERVISNYIVEIPLPPRGVHAVQHTIPVTNTI